MEHSCAEQVAQAFARGFILLPVAYVAAIAMLVGAFHLTKKKDKKDK